MNEQIVVWFFTSFFGALLFKLIDLIYQRQIKKESRKESKINFLLNHIKEYAELSALYRFKANISYKLLVDKKGKPKRDKKGNLISESVIFEPEPSFDNVIKKLKGSDINSAIIQKIASIRMDGSEVVDIVNEIDKTGKLREKINELYIKTIWSINLILKDKNSKDYAKSFQELMTALQEADNFRGYVRNEIENHLN